MLREIAAEYLSNELVFAPKRPLQTPQREWLAGELREFAQAQIGKIAESPYAHWFDLGALASEWKKYGDGDRQSSFHIWQWIGLGLQCGASAKAANKATD